MNKFTKHEDEQAGYLRLDALNRTHYATTEDKAAATLGLLARALELESMAQGIDPVNMKFFTSLPDTPQPKTIYGDFE